MIAYIDNMAGKKGANLKYGEPTRNVCATIPLSLDLTIRARATTDQSYSAALVHLARLGTQCEALGLPSAGFQGADGIGGRPDDASDSRPILASEQDKPRRPL